MLDLIKYPTITAILNTHTSPTSVGLTERAVQSLCQQQVNVPWEVVIVNDGKATDEMADMVEKYVDSSGEVDKLNVIKGSYIPQVKFFGTEEVSGYQCYPKNVATYHAKGEYISYLDYDNEWLPTHLASLYNALTEGSVWPDFTYGRRTYVIDPGCEIKQTLPGGQEIELKEFTSPLVEWGERSVQALGQGPMCNFIDSSDFMVAKGALWSMQLATNMMWNEGLRRFADWELITRGAHFVGWRGKAVDEVLTNYHWHGQNVQLTRGVKDMNIERVKVS